MLWGILWNWKKRSFLLNLILYGSRPTPAIANGGERLFSLYFRPACHSATGTLLLCYSSSATLLLCLTGLLCKLLFCSSSLWYSAALPVHHSQGKACSHPSKWGHVKRGAGQGQNHRPSQEICFKMSRHCAVRTEREFLKSHRRSHLRSKTTFQLKYRLSWLRRSDTFSNLLIGLWRGGFFPQFKSSMPPLLNQISNLVHGCQRDQTHNQGGNDFWNSPAWGPVGGNSGDGWKISLNGFYQELAAGKTRHDPLLSVKSRKRLRCFTS